MSPRGLSDGQRSRGEVTTAGSDGGHSELRRDGMIMIR